MGTIIESCTNCSKTREIEEEKEKKEEKKFEEEQNITTSIMPPNKKSTLKTEVGDKYCRGTITISKKEDDNNKSTKSSKRSGKSSLFFFTNLFYKQPLESYEILSEIAPNLKKVCLVNQTNIIRLMKIIDGKDILHDKNKKMGFLEDIRALQLLNHPNIGKIYEIYIFDDNIYLIVDYNEEDNLIENIKDKGLKDEISVKMIMNQIFNSIIYLHEKDIFNIELKLDNLFILEMTIKTKKRTLRDGKKKKENNDNNDKEKENDNLTKKIQVNISVLGYLNENYQTSDINSLQYYSPQIIEQIEKDDIKKNIINEENNKIDEWTCGLIMYYLITGELPFKESEKEELFSKIKNSEIDFTSEKFNLFSDSCKDLLSKLLEKDLNKRIKAQECLEHPFFAGEKLIKEKEEEKIEEYDIELLNNLLTITKPKSKFHELINAYLCFNFLDKGEEKKLSDLFKYIDQDHNNVISEVDIENAFKKNNIKYTDEHIKNILYVFDYDQSTLIEYQEFLRVLCDKEDLFKEENLKNVFNAIDTDKNNFINIEDIQKFVPNDEGIKNKIEKEFMEPFGMKNEDKMIYSQFCEIIINNKTYAEVNNFKSRYQKVKLMKEQLENKNEENENEENKNETNGN